jgi:hypothetical protein
MPSFQVTWRLSLQNTDGARHLLASLQRDRGVVRVVAIENPDVPGRVDFEVVLRYGHRQPQTSALQDLHLRYPADVGANIEEQVVEPPPAHLDHPRDDLGPFQTLYDEITGQRRKTQPMPLVKAPRRAPLPEKTIFDHLLDDDDDLPV